MTQPFLNILKFTFFRDTMYVIRFNDIDDIERVRLPIIYILGLLK